MTAGQIFLSILAMIGAVVVLGGGLGALAVYMLGETGQEEEHRELLVRLWDRTNPSQPNPYRHKEGA